tara:strand:+ start:391 stop:579 length:189 start_codon:yes stop_codon:yes gene_type:complete
MDYYLPDENGMGIYLLSQYGKETILISADPAIKKLADDSQIPFLPKLVEPVVMQEAIDILEV